MRSIKLSTAVVIAVLLGAVITTATMSLQKKRTDEAVLQANSVADPILQLCGGTQGRDIAQRLVDAGLCNTAASVKVSPVISNPDSLVSAPIPGPKGDKGDTGATGDPGEKGDKGDIGDKGSDGSPAISMILNGNGVVYNCQRSGGSKSAPVYNCPGLGGSFQPGIQPGPAEMPFPQANPGLPMMPQQMPRPWRAPRPTH